MPLDLTKVKYKLIALLPTGEQLVLHDPEQDNIQTLLSATLEENDGELASRLQVTLKNVKTDKGWIHLFVGPGKRILLQASDGSGWKEVFRGVVFWWKPSTDQSHVVNFRAYDTLYYLQKSKVHQYFKSGLSAEYCIKHVIEPWKVPIGNIDTPGTGLSKKIYRAQTIGEIIFDRLEELRKKGYGKYVVLDKLGKLNVLKEGSNTTVYYLTEDLMEIGENEYNIENLITRVEIRGNERGGIRASLKASKDGKIEFGILQEVIYDDSYESLTEAKKAADEILEERGEPEKEQTLTGPDIPWIRKGDKVNVKVGTINGEFIVKTISRNIDSYKMTLTLRGAS